MNEISTALKTLTDKITVKLEIGEKHFNVFLCIALCALVIYPLLFTAVVHFRTLPLGIQLLIVTGISVAYSVVLVPLSAFWVSKEWICYAPVGILSCMSGIYWVFACPLSGVDPNFIIFWRVMIILLPPMLLLGIAINLWELRHVKTGNRQSNSLRRQLFIIFFFIIVFTTYFLISNFFRSAVFTYPYISIIFYFLGDTIKDKRHTKKECPDKSKQHFGTVSYKSIHIFCSLSVFSLKHFSHHGL